MERFEKILRTLITEEDIDYNDIIKAINFTISDSDKEKILKELCSYADLGLSPDDVLECYMG